MPFNKRILCIAATLLGFSVTLPAGAANIGIFGGQSTSDQNAIEAFLDSNGHTATNFGSTLTAPNLAGLDVALLLRQPGNADLTAFVLGGGRLITEWDAAPYGMSLLGGTASSAGFVGGGVTITFTPAGLAMGLGNGLGATYSDTGRTDFFQSINSLGTGTVLANRPGSLPVIVSGSAGAGDVFVNAYDWADWSESPFGGLPNTQQLLLNEIAVGVNAIPEPSTYALMLAGLGIVGWAARRRMARDAARARSTASA